MLNGILLAGVMAFQAPAFAAEPSFNGRPLSSWLKDLRNTPAGPEFEPAVAAVRSIGSQAIPFLLERAGKLNPEQSLAITAMLALGTAAQPAIPDLRRMIEIPDSTFFAATVLAHLDPGSVIGELASKDSEIRDSAVLALSGPFAGEAAVDPLIKLLRTERKGKRHLIIFALGRIRKKESVTLRTLAESLRDDDSWVRKTSVEALYEFPPRKTFNLLLTALKSDDDPKVRSAAIYGLWMHLKDVSSSSRNEAIAAIKNAARDSDDTVKQQALWALKDVRVEP